MDSMLGYVEPPYKNIGFVSAKADDIANYLPARLSALLMLAAGGILRMDAKNGWKIFRRDRYQHASPNSAQTESVCAGLLGVRLAGDAWYHGVLHKKEHIGDALRPITHEDIPRTCRLMYATTVLVLLLGCAVRVLIFLCEGDTCCTEEKTAMAEIFMRATCALIFPRASARLARPRA